MSSRLCGGGLACQAFLSQGHQKGWLVRTSCDGPAACIPRCVPLCVCVHRTLDDSRIFRLLGPSSQCPYLGNMQLCSAPHPSSETERDRLEEPGWRGPVERGGWTAGWPSVTVARVSAVHGQLRGRRADTVRAVPGGGPASRRLLLAAEARSLPGLQHPVLRHRREER